MSAITLQNDVYMPPQADIKYLNDFDLSKLDEYFQPAEFERRMSTAKTHKIANSIMESKFISLPIFRFFIKDESMF